MEQLADRTWSWTLFRRDDGSLSLLVVCGSVGIYEIEVALTPAQAEAWQADGEAVLEEIAREVRNRPHHYAALARESSTIYAETSKLDP